MQGPHVTLALSDASEPKYPNHLEIRRKGDTEVTEYENEKEKRIPLANFKDSLSQMKFLKIL